ncbi:hypothetical protein evm_001475 [Chilo suppressalis]|nr:hypothetical protein evm_001475 [Chilo suppressalis]
MRALVVLALMAVVILQVHAYLIQHLDDGHQQVNYVLLKDYDDVASPSPYLALLPLKILEKNNLPLIRVIIL